MPTKPTREEMIEAIRAYLDVTGMIVNLNRHRPVMKALMDALIDKQLVPKE